MAEIQAAQRAAANAVAAMRAKGTQTKPPSDALIVRNIAELNYLLTVAQHTALIKYGGVWIYLPGQQAAPAYTTYGGRYPVHHPAVKFLPDIYTFQSQTLYSANYADYVNQYNVWHADSGWGFGGVFRSLASIATAPIRASVNATRAAVNGGSIAGAVTHTKVANTTLLKVGQVAGAAAAVYATGGAAGAALGAAGASAATVAAVTTGGMVGMGVAAGGQMLMNGYISPNAMAKAGIQGVVTGAAGAAQAAAINGLTSGSEAAQAAYKAYQAKKSIEALQAAKKAYDEAKRQGQLMAAQQAELDAINAEIARLNKPSNNAQPLPPREALALQTQQPAAPVVAGQTTTPAPAKPSPMPLVAGGLVALKVLALL